MSRISLLGAIGLLLVGGLVGCRDQLPTATGPERFPGGVLLTSVVVELAATDFIEQLDQFTGYTSVRNAGYGIVANNFDGGLNARTLYRLAAFPETVSFTTNGVATVDSVFVYTAGELVAHVDTSATAVSGSITLRLHTVAQEWDPGSATWTLAVDTAGASVPWTQPGGAIGAELARATWTPGDTLLQDTIRWAIDSLEVAQMAAEGFGGLIVVAEGTPARVQLGSASLRAGARPAARPDTVITQVVAAAQRTFVFNPAPPQPGPPGTSWLVGGVGSARTLFRVTLPERLRACPPGAPPGTACPEHPLREVTLNEIALILEPEPVGGGFRLLAPTTLRLRTVTEPELGRRAPLGPPAVGRQLPGGILNADAVLTRELFAAPVDTTVTLVLTDHFRGAIARDTTAVPARVSTAFALLTEPEGANFGYARFVPTPRLRIVYTLPIQRTSP